jgi:hypothetical protein
MGFRVLILVSVKLGFTATRLPCPLRGPKSGDFVTALHMGEARYGVRRCRDVGMGAIASCQDDGWSAEECVGWFAGKWELVGLSEPG